MPKSLFAAIILILGIIGGPSPAPAGVFNPETFTLDNGMAVVVVPNARAPVLPVEAEARLLRDIVRFDHLAAAFSGRCGHHL